MGSTDSTNELEWSEKLLKECNSRLLSKVRKLLLGRCSSTVFNSSAKKEMTSTACGALWFCGACSEAPVAARRMVLKVDELVVGLTDYTRNACDVRWCVVSFNIIIMVVLGYTVAELGIILACFTCNLSLVNSVKYIQYTLHYPYPLLISAMHMIFSWLACGIYVKFNVPALREYTFVRYMKEVFPVAGMASLSIGCGNMALKYIFPSFHELLQQTSPAAQVLVCVLIYHQKYNLPTYLSMIPICGGAIMCSGGEVNFNAIGVFFSIGAVITRALKNTMQAHLMTVSFSTIELLFVLAPANLFFFMAASIISEGPIEPIGNLLKSPGAFIAVIASSVLACSYNLLAFKMLQVLSPVGAMVVHTLKTPAMLLISFMLFGNQIGIMQIIGFIVITVGVHYYKKYGKEIKDDDYVVVGSSSPKGKRELDEFDLEGNHDAEVKSVSSDLDDSI